MIADVLARAAAAGVAGDARGVLATARARLEAYRRSGARPEKWRERFVCFKNVATGSSSADNPADQNYVGGGQCGEHSLPQLQPLSRR
jgi:hypothetical protein